MHLSLSGRDSFKEPGAGRVWGAHLSSDGSGTLWMCPICSVGGLGGQSTPIKGERLNPQARLATGYIHKPASEPLGIAAAVPRRACGYVRLALSEGLGVKGQGLAVRAPQCSSLFFITIKPRNEGYKRQSALNTSPPRNRCTFL